MVQAYNPLSPIGSSGLYASQVGVGWGPSRRNKGVFVSLAAVFVVLLAGVITSTSLYVRAERARMEQSRERQRVESERDKAERIADFMERVLGSLEPFVARGRDTKLIEDGPSDTATDPVTTESP